MVNSRRTVEQTGVNAIRRSPEHCPDCEGEVVVRLVPGSRDIQLYNLDGSQHVCRNDERPVYEKHPIGAAMVGSKVVDFQLKGRILTITLDGGNVLTVSAAGKPLSIQMSGPGGTIME